MATGLEEVVTAAGIGGYVQHNLGRGIWHQEGFFFVGEGTRRMRLADLDGNGLVDAVLLGDQGVRTLLLQPGMVFSPPAAPHAIPSSNDLDVADVDGDGDVDAVATSSQGPLLLANPGNGALAAPCACRERRQAPSAHAPFTISTATATPIWCSGL
jgi:hypothetical protein